MRLLAGEARAAGRDPASDPVPGLRRDVLFASTADEETGGLAGAAWLAMEHPEHLRAAAAINEAGGVAVDVGGRRLYPIQVAEKGTTTYRLTFHGTWGHGSMPRADNALVLAAEAVARLAAPSPVRLTDVTRRFLDGAVAATATATKAAARRPARPRRGRPGASAKALEAVCSPVYARALDAMLRDTLSHERAPRRREVQRDPGRGGPRDRLPAPARDDASRRWRRGSAIGSGRSSLARHRDRAAHRQRRRRQRHTRTRTGLYPILEAVIREHDPEGVPLPVMAPFSTDAKHLQELGVPMFGFSPLRQPPGRDLSRSLPRDRRAGVARGPSLGPARPLRCRAEVLRMTFVHRIWRLGLVAALLAHRRCGDLARARRDHRREHRRQAVRARADRGRAGRHGDVDRHEGDRRARTRSRRASPVDADKGSAFNSQTTDPDLAKLKDNGGSVLVHVRRRRARTPTSASSTRST